MRFIMDCRIADAEKALDVLCNRAGQPLGCLIDPVTGRRLLVCYSCGDLVWLPAQPCVVATQCQTCASQCWRCSVPMEYTSAQKTGQIDDGPGGRGRPCCAACWDLVDHEPSGNPQFRPIGEL